MVLCEENCPETEHYFDVCILAMAIESIDVPQNLAIVKRSSSLGLYHDQNQADGFRKARAKWATWKKT